MVTSRSRRTCLATSCNSPTVCTGWGSGRSVPPQRTRACTPPVGALTTITRSVAKSATTNSRMESPLKTLGKSGGPFMKSAWTTDMSFATGAGCSHPRARSGTSRLAAEKNSVFMVRLRLLETAIVIRVAYCPLGLRVDIHRSWRPSPPNRIDVKISVRPSRDSTGCESRSGVLIGESKLVGFDQGSWADCRVKRQMSKLPKPPARNEDRSAERVAVIRHRDPVDVEAAAGGRSIEVHESVRLSWLMHVKRALLVDRRIHIRSEVHRRAPDVPVRAGAHAMGDIKVAEAETTIARTIEEQEAAVFRQRRCGVDRVAVDRRTEIHRDFPIARQTAAMRHPDIEVAETAGACRDEEERMGVGREAGVGVEGAGIYQRAEIDRVGPLGAGEAIRQK